jgi:pyochelin biosynthetic protein PchG
VSSRTPTSLRIVVCGTAFGQVYLEALRQKGPPFELIGILARGSKRSRCCAAFYQVPLFTKVEELPSNIDLACVVVRGSLLGGKGTELALSLMARGIHVLQEHPVHHDELAECLRQARLLQVQYQLNSFYPYLPTVRRFVKAAEVLLSQRRALYIDAAVSFQVSFALLDILRITLGKARPWAIASVHPPRQARSRSAEQTPFTSLDGAFGGVPLSLRVQNQLRPSDPDDTLHLLHRITLGSEAGELTLASTHGPLIWGARPAIPREIRDADTTSLFAEEVAPSDDTCTALIGPAEESSQHSLFHTLWPDAARRALLELRQFILNGDDPLRRGQHHLTLCRIWQNIAQELGPPELVRATTRPLPLSPSELNAMRMIGCEVDRDPKSPSKWQRRGGLDEH